MLNDQGRPTSPAAANSAAAHETFTGNRGLQIEEPLLFEIGRHDVTGVDLPDAAEGEIAPRRARAQDADRPSRPLRAGDDAPLRAPQPEELRDRRRHLSARLVHDEAQSAPQREDGAAAGLRRHPPAAAALDRAGRARADRRARPLAARA